MPFCREVCLAAKTRQAVTPIAAGARRACPGPGGFQAAGMLHASAASFDDQPTVHG